MTALRASLPGAATRAFAGFRR
ncbi:MAG: hypothetical protein QOK49_377, partial [Baekduia sp.]|nr:hypothetical protein [Baekduia sp.]